MAFITWPQLTPYAITLKDSSSAWGKFLPKTWTDKDQWTEVRKWLKLSTIGICPQMCLFPRWCTLRQKAKKLLKKLMTHSHLLLKVKKHFHEFWNLSGFKGDFLRASWNGTEKKYLRRHKKKIRNLQGSSECCKVIRQKLFAAVAESLVVEKICKFIDHLGWAFAFQCS